MPPLCLLTPSLSASRFLLGTCCWASRSNPWEVSGLNAFPAKNCVQQQLLPLVPQAFPRAVSQKSAVELPNLDVKKLRINASKKAFCFAEISLPALALGHLDLLLRQSDHIDDG